MIKKILLTIAILGLFTGCISIPKAKPVVQKVYTSDKDVLMFILDGSGSMRENDSSGKVKMGAAKEMLKDISSQLDNQKTNVGLIGFSAGCRSSKLLIEPSNNDLEHVIKVSSTIKASGKTPLAASIRKAGQVLQNINKKVNIIIISDGVETCKGDPVYEAKQLKIRYGLDVKLYVIGYSVDNRTKSQLQNLAQAGSGNYYDAKDGAALSTVITSITDELDIKSSNWEGSTYKFKINFKSGSTKLDSKYNEQVQNLANYLINTNYSTELQGHTDSQGSQGSNQRLSQKRAQDIANKLIGFGVPKDNVYAVGFGELAPIATNKTKQGRFDNRRVEAHIIKDGKMNIAYINQANCRQVINVKNATKNSFIGYYKILDPNRSYDKYHVWMELYANEHGIYGEYTNNISAVEPGKEGLSWTFNKRAGKITLDYSNNGEKPGWAKFEGKITGTTNKFKLSGHWGGGKKGSVTLYRISQAEIECMKKIGKQCSKLAIPTAKKTNKSSNKILGTYNAKDSGSINIKEDLSFYYSNINSKGNMCLIEGKFIEKNNTLAYTFTEYGNTCNIDIKYVDSKSIDFSNEGCDTLCGRGVYVNDGTYKK